MISMENWPRGLAHELIQNKRLEAQGVVLWCFRERDHAETHYLATLPNRAVVSSSAGPDPEAHFNARTAVVEAARVALAKSRTPAHVIFFNKLSQKRDQT